MIAPQIQCGYSTSAGVTHGMAAKRKKKRRVATAKRTPAQVRSRVDQLKDELKRLREAGTRKLAVARKRSPHMVGLVVLAIGQGLLIVTAPFLVLVRGAVWLYESHGVPGWAALTLAGWATLMLLSLYSASLSRRFTGRARWNQVAKWIAAPLVVGYLAFSLLYLARGNAKDDVIRSVYTSTHPILRVALTTMMLVDRKAVITDIARTPDDYKRMGLAVSQRSMHYPQADGWVHAVDLRTRSPFRSVLVDWYFRLMGFDTLRHTGTSDHLHVQLAVAR